MKARILSGLVLITEGINMKAPCLWMVGEKVGDNILPRNYLILLQCVHKVVRVIQSEFLNLRTIGSDQLNSQREFTAAAVAQAHISNLQADGWICVLW